MDTKRLLSALRPLKIKMSLETLLIYFLLGGGIGVSLGACVIVYSKFVFVPNWFMIASCVALCGAFLAVLYALFWKMPNGFSIASAADNLGFKERFVTAYELVKGIGTANTEFVPLVINDAANHAENADFRKLYKIKAPKQVLAFFFLALSAAVIITLVPSPNSEDFKLFTELRDKVSVEAEEITKAAEQEASTLTDNDAQELMSKIEELTKELESSKSEAEAIRAVQKAQEELKKISNNSVSKDLKALGEKLAANEKTRDLGESLQKADIDAIKRNMDSISDFLSSADEDELKAFSENIKDLSANIADNPELSELLDSLADAAESGMLGDLSENVSALEQGIAEAAARSQDLRDAISRLSESLSQSSGRISANRGETGDNTSSSGENSGTEGHGSNSREQSPDGQAQGEGQTQGSGQAQGNGQGAGSQGQTPGGSGRGSGHIENESIYSRDADAMRDSELRLQGEQTEAGNMNTSIGSGIGMDGGSVPYDEVFSSYREEALRSLEDTEIPFGLREIVKDYFSALE